MTKLLHKFLFVLKVSLGLGNNRYVRDAERVCLSSGFGCENSPSCSFQVKVDERVIVQDVYVGGNRVTLTLSPEIQNRSNILQTFTNYTLCLSDMTVSDAGVYFFETNGKSIPMNVYVLASKNNIFVNSTDAVCLSGGFGCANTQSCIYQIKVGKKIIVKDVYVGNNRITLSLEPEIQNRSTILQTISNYTLCLSNVNVRDAGMYEFERGEMNTSMTLYVLEKPCAPKLKVIDNGTVDFTPAEIECQSNSNSAPTGLDFSYKWLVNDSSIETDGTQYKYFNGDSSILLIDVNRMDRGNTYSCIAKEKHGQSAFSVNGVQINPRSPPLVQITPNTELIKVVDSETFTMSCEISGDVPTVQSISWYKDDQLLQTGHSTSFSFLNITRKEAGTYNCTASNGLNRNGSDIIVIDVLYGPLIEAMPPVSQEEGQNITVICDIRSNPLTEEEDVVWTKANNSSFKELGKSLVLHNLSRDDDGIYRCTTMLILKPSFGAAVKRSSSRTMTINVLFGPENIKITPVNQTYIVPENTAVGPIYCFSLCLPVCKHEWTGPGIHSRLETLYINSITSNQTGFYTCKASNGYGYKVKQIKISVLHGPRNVSLLPSTRVITVNESQEIGPIICVADCVPNCSYIWSGIDLLRYESQLHINDMQISQNGTYTCTASNMYGNSTISVDVIVMSKPRLKTEFCRTQQIYGLAIGMNLNISVDIIANPEPLFQWMFRGVESHKNIMVNSTVTSDRFEHKTLLFIPNITTEHYGSYICYASNILGSSVAPFDVGNQGKPAAPSVESVCSSTFATVIWKSEFDGGSKQTFFIQYWNEHQKVNLTTELINDPGFDSYIHYKIQSLYSETLYEFVLVANNTIGRSFSKVKSCTTTSNTEKCTSTTDGNTMLTVGISLFTIAVVCFITIVAVILYHRLYRQKDSKKRSKAYMEFQSNDDKVTACYDTIDDNINVARKTDIINDTPTSTNTYDECQLYEKVGEASK